MAWRFFVGAPVYVLLGPRLFSLLCLVWCALIATAWYRRRGTPKASSWSPSVVIGHVARGLSLTVFGAALSLGLIWLAVLGPAQQLFFPPNEALRSALGVGEGYSFPHHARNFAGHLCRNVWEFPPSLCDHHPTVEYERVERVATTPGRSISIDVLFSRNVSREAGVDPEKKPVIVFLHGGGWVAGNKRIQGLPVLLELARRGYVTFSIGYGLIDPLPYVLPRLGVVAVLWAGFGLLLPGRLRRLTLSALAVTLAFLFFVGSSRLRNSEAEISMREIRDDVNAGVAWARTNAPRWKGDHTEFFAVFGQSAGAHLALLSSMTADPSAEKGGRVFDAVVPVYPASTFHDGEWNLPVFEDMFDNVLFKGCEAEGGWRDFAPLHVCERAHAAESRPHPRYLFVHGNADTLVPISHSHAMVRRLHEVGAKHLVDFREIPGCQHACDAFPTSFAGAEVADLIVEWLEDSRRLTSDGKYQ